MNNLEIVELIKTILKSKVEELSSVPDPAFFETTKSGILDIAKMFPAIAKKDTQTIDQLYLTAKNEFLSVSPIDIDPSGSITKKDFKTWLTTERKATIPKDYINRYLIHLAKESRSDKVIEEISNSSEKILSKLGDPRSDKAYYVRGLVVGSVQSGKTGNFSAVINRAIDSGYSLIIILSGIMEDLRKQTQLRIDKDVIGEGVIDIQKGQVREIGVGKIKKFGEHGDQSVRQVFSLTSYKSDFRRSVKESDFSLNNKNILICKKNTGVLKNLLLWLNEHLSENTAKHNIPLLIIDDESDNASLNNLGHKGKEYASTINGHIRAILGLFSKKTYLGYTATPFANVLQDRNDLYEGKWLISYRLNGETVTKSFEQVDHIFPDDFIELLNPPSNYIGAKQIFETVLDTDAKKIPLVEAITDYQNSFPSKVVDENGTVRPATESELEDPNTDIRSPWKDDPFPLELPGSLVEAIQCFVLSIALRLSRKPKMVDSKLYIPHHTMLVHVSRFIPWQNRTKKLVSECISELESQVLNDLPTSEKSIYARLEIVWNKYYESIVANIRSYLTEGYYDEFLEPQKYSDIKSLLIEAVKGIEVKAINSEAKDTLTYAEDTSRNGKKYIAIGGNRLSRGFTLEGLAINYFIRDTNFSDTLLQMGRWFGYRPGYLDCCKLFTTFDAIEKFNLTTLTIEELEFEFKRMQKLKKTPRDFEIRVKKHPGALKITRPAILKNTEDVNWSYQDKLVQTTEFDLKPDKLSNAWDDFRRLIAQFGNKLSYNEKTGFIVLKTDHKELFDFLNIRNSFHDFDNELSQIKRFIELCVSNKKLQKWGIAIKCKGDGNILPKINSGLQVDIEMTLRSGPKPEAGHYRTEFITNGVFTGSGRSANIVTAAKDFAVLLTKEEIEQADEQFINERIEYFINEKKMDKKAATSAAAKTNKPERIYREKMDDTTGLLVIYLIDAEYVFRQNKTSDSDTEMNNFVKNKGIDIHIPFIGYAIGFPPISPDPGSVYLKGKYNIQEDETEVEEFDEELNAEE